MSQLSCRITRNSPTTTETKSEKLDTASRVFSQSHLLVSGLLLPRLLAASGFKKPTKAPASTLDECLCSMLCPLLRPHFLLTLWSLLWNKMAVRPQSTFKRVNKHHGL